jgi:hypothetical protein
MKLATFEKTSTLIPTVTHVLSIDMEEAKLLIPCGKNIMIPCNKQRRESEILSEMLAKGAPRFGAQKKIILECL